MTIASLTPTFNLTNPTRAGFSAREKLENIMAWNIIRKATTEDKIAINAAAERFCNRHAIKPNGFDSVDAIECEIDCNEYNGVYLKKLWRAVVRRALDDKRADGIAHGYVGYN